MKNILIVLGGGRPNGNTVQLATAFAKGAEEASHNVETVSLMEMEVKGCRGCNACRYGKYPEKDCALLMTAAATPTASRRYRRRAIWKRHISLENHCIPVMENEEFKGDSVNRF